MGLRSAGRRAGRTGRGRAPDAAAAVEGFRAEVGTEDPVTVAGGRTQWEVGGQADPGARTVSAPAGVVEHRPEEMIVRVLAGTTVAGLSEVLLRGGQMVPLDPWRADLATVGGVLAVGQSGLRRLRHGPVRDHVLELRYVSAAGELVRAGAPVVKNVSGFDLVRLMVGALGTLGFLAEAVLRTYPAPRASRWMVSPPSGPEEIASARARLYRPSSWLWDGERSWVLLEGHPADVDQQAEALGPAWQECPGPPPRPGPGRLSLAPGQVTRWAEGRPPGSFLAEVGVGIVHLPEVPTAPQADPAGAEIARRLKARFDPTGRLNPGRELGAP